MIGLPISTHQESVLLDGSGRLQLSEEAMRAVRLDGRAELRVSADHVELWPVGVRDFSADEVMAASTGIGLPAQLYRESVLIDRAGRLQLSEEALHRVPSKGHAVVRTLSDHIELWPIG